MSAELAELLQQARPYLRDADALPSGAHAFVQEGAVQLYHLRYEQVTSDGLSALVVQHVYQVRNRLAAENFALDNLWYDSARTSFHLVRAQVLRGSQVLEGRDGGDIRLGATGNQPREVALPRLHAGDRINVVYVLTPNRGHDWAMLGEHFLGNLFAFRDSFPTVDVRYVLAARQPMTVSQEGAAPPEKTTAGEWTRWSWDVRDQPAFFHSADGPSITDVSPFVQVSGFDSWQALADWYSGVLAERAQLSPQFERRLLRLGSPAGEPAAMAAAVSPALAPAAVRAQATVARVWGYLSAHLTYTGNEAGIHAFVPAPVEKVFQTGQGDCKDGALLLVTWLRAAGVEADLALVRTPAMGRLAPPERDAATGRETVPATMAAFDHALVYIPATQQWLDTTAPDLVEGELPSSDQNSLALIVRSGQQELVRIPSSSAQANQTRRVVRLTPAGDGWLQAEGSIEVRGADAAGLRSRYGNPATQARTLQAWMTSYFPGSRVESVQVDGVQPANDTVRVGFRARLQPHTFTAAWIERHYAEQLAAQSVRQEPLQVPLRWSLDETWSLRLDRPGECESLAAQPAVNEQARFGDLQISWSCSKGWLSVHSAIRQNTQRVAAADYPAYRQFWRQVDARLDAPLSAAPRLLAGLRLPVPPLPSQATASADVVLTAARP